MKKVSRHFGIVGGGLAGTLLASHLPANETVIIDKASVDAGSRSPAAIFHPFPGRSIRETRELAWALQIAVPLYRKWESLFSSDVQEFVMIRPLEGESGERLRRGFGNEDRAEVAGISVALAEASEIQALYPEILLNSDCLVYGPCFSIALKDILDEIAEIQVRDGLRIRGSAVDIQRDQKGWKIVTDDAEIDVNVLVYACGTGLFSWLPSLRGTRERGQLMEVSGSSLSAVISQSGFHACPWKRGVVIGATRWKADETPVSASDASELLMSHYTSLMASPGEGEEVWEGERMVTEGQRLPYAGPVRDVEDAYVLGGLGSKGLLYGPVAARHLAEQLLEGVPPHPSFLPRWKE